MPFPFLGILKGAVRVLLSTLVIIAIGLFLFARYAEKTAIFYPKKQLTVNPGLLGLSYDNVFFTTADGVKLHGWYLRAGGTGPPTAGEQDVGGPAPPVVIYFHGNAGNIGDRLEKVSHLLKIGLDVFLFDYRGYGLSAGVPSEAGLYRDAFAAYEYVCQRPGVIPSRIIAYGTSLGGVPASELSAQRTLGALIIDSSFSSAADMARRMYPFIPSFLLSVKMDSVQRLQEVHIPKLFIHSPQDELVPYDLGRKLFEAAAAPKEFLVTHGRHNDNYIESKDIWIEGIRGFLTRYHFLQR